MPGDIGRRVATLLRQVSHVFLSVPQQIEDAQPRGFGKNLEVGSDLLKGFGGHFFHRGISVHWEHMIHY